MNIQNELVFSIPRFLSSVFEWMLCLHYICSISGIKVNKIALRTATTITIATVITVKCFNFLYIGTIVTDPIMLLYLRILAKILVATLTVCFLLYSCNGNLFSKIRTLIVPVILLSLANNVHLLIGYFCNFIQKEQLLLYILVLTISFDIIYAFCSISAARLVKSKQTIFNKEDSKMMFVAFLVSTVVLVVSSIALSVFMSTASLKNIVYIMVTVLSVLVVDIVILNLIIRVSRNNYQKRQDELKEIGRNFQEQYEKNIKEQDEAICRLRHDIKHHLCVVDVLLTEQKYNDAHKYLQEYLNTNEINTYIYTKNEYVNAIINSKISLAKRKSINITSVVAGDICNVDNIDICNLLGNLLDNAIEASEKSIVKTIIFKIIVQEDIIRISTQNSIDSSILSDNPNLQTSKSHKQSHGYGTKTIKEIAAKYNGFVDYYEDNNRFVCNVSLVKKY